MMPSDENPNWFVLHRWRNGRPAEFLEFICRENSLFRGSGKVETWGEEARLEFDDSSAAIRELETQVAAAVADGFRLERAWRLEANKFDYALLSLEIELASRQALADLRNSRGSDQVASFALVTDVSVMTVGPVANGTSSDPDVRWNAAEWQYWERGEYFDLAYRYLLSFARKRHPELPFKSFREGALEAMVAALERMVDAGLFGTEDGRERFTILVQVMDADCLCDAIRRLNTPNVWRQFDEWHASWRA